ncbi:MAG: phytanoyl-CoA dioxygenase family protein [Candidatus Poribacteria bacterium]|nr:phytanoyl-CoA dioxygenase family protein [Candidatus Poribacteria bacterium]
MAYKELVTKKPFIVNKNLGSAVEVEPEELTLTNADGVPVSPPTQKQKYDFDRNGWLLIPSVLSDADISEMRDFCQRLQVSPEHIPEPERCALGGPLQKLADHPVVVGFLNEFLAYPPAASEDCYGFRLEETTALFGNTTTPSDAESVLQKGNGLFRLPGDSHLYRCVPGRGWSGLTRVLWELTEVTVQTNSIRFIAGSHKAAYPIPETVQNPNSSLWETYECPPGSVIFFTESLTQAQVESNATDQVCISNLYNTVASRWSNWLPPSQLLEAMPPKRQTLFRGTYAGGNVINGDFNRRTSAYPAEI